MCAMLARITFGGTMYADPLIPACQKLKRVNVWRQYIHTGYRVARTLFGFVSLALLLVAGIRSQPHR
jgi:hypothetical protein